MEESSPKIDVVVSTEEHVKYVEEILDTINRAAKVRGTGIAKRSPEYVKQKMLFKFFLNSTTLGAIGN